MKDVCKITGISYETLKFYCNQGLVPNVKRDEHNFRIFDQHDIEWIKSLTCLKRCGMSINEMKEYLSLCLQGIKSIPQRKVILETKQKELFLKLKEVQDSIDYINWKQNFYDEVLSGKKNTSVTLSLKKIMNLSHLS